MSGYVTLVGAEDVARAGSSMVSAAESISRSIGFFEEALQRDLQQRRELLELEHARREEQLARLEALVGQLERLELRPASTTAMLNGWPTCVARIRKPSAL